MCESFNISTTSGIVAAAAGVPIAKHGNRSVSSKSGAADVLEALGVNISISPEKMGKVLAECNMSFMFAQVYHKAMKYAGPVRKALGIPTVFNILGLSPTRQRLRCRSWEYTRRSLLIRWLLYLLVLV